MDASIRMARIDDYESISLLSDQLGYLSANNSIKDRLTEILKRADNCVFVFVDEDTVIGWIHGFCSLRLESDAFVEIGGLVVSDSHQKKGIGKKLVDEVVTWAKSKKSSKVRVRCNVLRTGSHNFYEKIGFDLKKEQKIFDKQLPGNH